MRTWVLGSGSRGNAVLLECEGSRVLVDAGFAPRALAERLARVGVAPESIEAVIVTHEHTDHVKGAAAAARRWDWAIYATAGTAASPELAGADVRTFEGGGTLSLSRMDVLTVPVPHDAAEPVALVATAHGSGVRVGVAYDFGFVTPAIAAAFRDLDVLVLESNHDEEMLRTGPYPASVQSRIAGRRGHLSNRAAAAMGRGCAHGALNHLVLAHLSEKCNAPALATAAMAEALGGTRFRGRVSAATQDGVVGPFAPRAGRARAAVQLGLEL